MVGVDGVGGVGGVGGVIGMEWSGVSGGRGRYDAEGLLESNRTQ